MPLPQFDTGEDCSRTMDPSTGFYRHPYAGVVTAVFLFSVLITGLYFFDLIPGLQKTQREFTILLGITAVLLVATAASWITALVLARDRFNS